MRCCALKNDYANDLESCDSFLMSDFRKLQVWHKAHSLAMDVHREAVRFRGSSHSNLRTQLIRAAESIPDNIVEGSGEQTPAEFIKYLRSSLNSSTEVEYHLMKARDRSLVSKSRCDELTERTVEVRKMLYGLIRHQRGKLE